MNILIVHNYYKLPGGEDTVVSNEKNMLQKHGHNVVLYTRNNKELDNLGKLKKVFLPVNTVFSMETYKAIKRLILDNKIDIVHVHNTLNLISPSVYYAAKKLGVPVVQTVHNFRMLCPAATFYRNGMICEDCIKKGLGCSVRNSCYRNSKIQTFASALTLKIHRMLGIYGKINYICLTEFNKEKLLNIKQIHREKVYVKPNFATETECSHKLTEAADKSGYIFAGRLEKIKGIDILLKAWKELGENAPHLIICGMGDLNKKCQEYARKNNLNSVEFKGQTSHDELMQYMKASKALIFPSTWYEGFPVTIAESYMSGTPVIAGNIGNGGDLVLDNKTGIKYEYSMPLALADAVRRMEKMEISQYSELSKNAYIMYAENYTEEKNYDSLIDIYEQVVAGIRG